MIRVDQVSEQIKTFIKANSAAARNRRIGNDDRLLESGILDSLGVLDLLGFIEGTFKVSFADDELVPENFQTVACLAVVIEKKFAEQVGGMS